MAREILLTTEQIEALRKLHFAAQSAEALLGDEQAVAWRLRDVGKHSEEALLIAMGHPPAWVDRIDRESEGHPLRSAVHQGCPLKWGTSSILRHHGAVTLEEVSEWSRDDVGAMPGIGPHRLKEIDAALASVELEFA
jgi:hypothetical protein